MKGRTVIITGATGGIGMQTAIALASKGASVIITERNEESGKAAVLEIVKQSGNSEVSLLTSDLSTVSGVEHLAREITAKQIPLNVLVNFV